MWRFLAGHLWLTGEIIGSLRAARRSRSGHHCCWSKAHKGLSLLLQTCLQLHFYVFFTGGPWTNKHPVTQAHSPCWPTMIWYTLVPCVDSFWYLFSYFKPGELCRKDIGTAYPGQCTTKDWKHWCQCYVITVSAYELNLIQMVIQLKWNEHIRHWKLIIYSCRHEKFKTPVCVVYELNKAKNKNWKTDRTNR